MRKVSQTSDVLTRFRSRAGDGATPEGGEVADRSGGAGDYAHGAPTTQLVSSAHDVALSHGFEPPSLAMYPV